MKSPVRAVLLALLVPWVAIASETDEDTDADTAEVATEIDTLPPVHTSFSTDPLTLLLSGTPNLTVERSIWGPISLQAYGHWSFGDMSKRLSGSVRYHFKPGLAGGSVGIFARGFEERIPLEVEEDDEKRTYTLSQEGVVVGVNYNSFKRYRNGFCYAWGLGLGWPFMYQEWVGGAPKENKSLYRKIFLVTSAIDGGFSLGYAF